MDIFVCLKNRKINLLVTIFVVFKSLTCCNSILYDDCDTLCMALQKYIEFLIVSYEKMFGGKPSAKMYFPLERLDYPEHDDS